MMKRLSSAYAVQEMGFKPTDKKGGFGSK